MSTKAEVQDMEKKFNERMSVTEALCKNNTQAIANLAVGQAKLTNSLETLTESTQGIVDVTNAGKTLGKLIQWLSSFAVLGAFLYWLATQAVGVL